jgi:hypothetical protein
MPETHVLGYALESNECMHAAAVLSGTLLSGPNWWSAKQMQHNLQ